MDNKAKYILVMFSVLVLILSVYALKLEPFYSFSLRFNDLNFAFQTKKASQEVLFVKIDEASVNRFGRWPWDRSVLARAVDHLDGSNILVLDMVFSEPTAGDERFARSIEEQGNALCGFFLRHQSSFPLSGEQIDVLSDSSLERLASNLEGRPFFVEGRFAEVNTEPILSSCAFSGIFSSLRDRDQLFRQYPLAFSFENELYPSIGVQALRMRFNKDILHLKGRSFDLDGHTIMTDSKGFALLNFYPQQSFLTSSFLELYEGKLSREFLKDKIVILGIAEVGVGDMRATPVGMLPGPLIHATFISNVLNDDLLYRNNWLHRGVILLFFFLPFVWMVTASIFRRVMLYALAYLFVFAWSKILFIYFNIYLDVFYPLLTLIVSAMASEFMLHRAQEKQSRFIEGAFSSYLSPVLLKQLMKEPERLSLGGEKKELTVFFSDIRSFTSISEAMDPQKLTQYLNRYFTPMSEIVLKHGGMIDKYIGDAVMAFYNAPVDVEDHAAQACHSALEMIDRLKRLNEEFAAEGLPAIEIGIGLNTAEVVVGNMGSTQRFNYTVIGDGVNLASRVEGINKNYGTHILITEFTKASIGDEFLTREIERVKVKGKEEEVMLYELLSNTVENVQRIKRYTMALDLYKKGRKEEALKAFEKLGDDSVSQYFVRRIEDEQ